MSVVTLDVTEARYFFLAALAILLCFISILTIAIIRSFGETRYIVLSDQYISSPKNTFSSKNEHILVRNILSINSKFIAKKEVLYITHNKGVIVISELVFENEFEFNVFKADLYKYVSNAKNS
ncbi:hypothetical protein [Zooshikella sp. RANM57]|uniref:hypothetical protein n=1 Tax=Zooshikella sp. RANM57 TaxID=3425863 RepID=UPI003D6F57AD